MTYASFGWVGFSDNTQFQYPDIKSDGDYEKFNQWNWTKGEAYVFRFECVPPKHVADFWLQRYAASMPLVRAFIASWPSGSRGTDVIALALKPVGSGNLTQVEIIFKDAGFAHTGGDRAGETLDKMREFLEEEDLHYNLGRPAYAVLGPTKEARRATIRWIGSPVIWSASQYLKATGGAIGVELSKFTNWEMGFTDFGVKGGGFWLGSALATSRELSGVPQPKVLPPSETTPTDSTEPAVSPWGARRPGSLGEPEKDLTPWIIGGIAMATGVAYYYLTKAGER